MEEAPVKNKGGRPRKDANVFRTSLHFYAEKSHEDWLNREKERTGMSWGEIIDSLVAAEAMKEVAHVEQA